MNITLFSSNYDFWGIGIRKLASALANEGHRVRLVFVLHSVDGPWHSLFRELDSKQVIDFGYPKDQAQLNAFLKEEHLIGVSTFSLPLFRKTASGILNNYTGDAIRCVGGVHATMDPDDAVKLNVDIVCRGDGEGVLKKIAAVKPLDSIPLDIPGT